MHGCCPKSICRWRGGGVERERLGDQVASSAGSVKVASKAVYKKKKKKKPTGQPSSLSKQEMSRATFYLLFEVKSRNLAAESRQTKFGLDISQESVQIKISIQGDISYHLFNRIVKFRMFDQNMPFA